MRLFKPSGSQVWYVDFTFNRKRYRTSTGCTRKKEARQFGLEWEAQVKEWCQEKNKPKEKPNKTFRETVERYLEEETVNKTETSQRDEKRFGRVFIDLFGDYQLEAVTPDIISKYFSKRSQEVGPCSVNRERAFLSVMFNHAMKVWGWCESNPIARIKKAKEPVRNKYFREEQFDALYRKLVDWVKPVVLLGKHTGLRLSNLCLLQWNEVNLKKRLIVLSGEKMKNSENFNLPLNKIAMEVLQQQWDLKSRAKNSKRTREFKKSPYVFCHSTTGKPYTKYGVYKAFKKGCKAAKLHGFRFHDLRHSFATHILMSGEVDVFTLKQLMAHKCLATTLRYAHVNVEKIRKGVEVLEGGEKV